MKPSEMQRPFRNCECKCCFYCDIRLSRHEHDHYPIPKSAGGTQVVAACIDCHDFKDRISLNNWEHGPTSAAFSELLGGIDLSQYAGPHERLLFNPLWKCPELTEAAIAARWSSLTPVARVLYAKFRGIYEIEFYEAQRPAL